MIDLKLNELPVDGQSDFDTDFENNPSIPKAQKAEIRLRRQRSGLSINDTVAAAAATSVGARGVGTSGTESGAGAGAGMTKLTPPAPENRRHPMFPLRRIDPRIYKTISNARSDLRGRPGILLWFFKGYSGLRLRGRRFRSLSARCRALARCSLLRFGRRRIWLEDGRLTFHDRLRLVLFFFDGRLGRRRQAEPADKTPRQDARSGRALHRAQSNDRLVLGVVQEFRNCWKPYSLRLNSGCSACTHCSSSSAAAPFFEFHAMRLEHIAQQRQRFFWLAGSLSREYGRRGARSCSGRPSR